MEGTNFLTTHTWKPFARFNLTHPFFTVNKETIVNTWLVLLVILALIVIVRFFLRQKSGVMKFLILSFAEFFIDLTKQTLGRFSSKHFYFTTAVFVFIALCNTITLFPWTEEPTADINTTLAMGILAFIYSQVYAIRAHGIWNYIKEYFTPIFVMMPLHVIGKLASIISLSFRLFGNIFGGAVISKIYLSAISGSLVLEIVGLPLGLIITFFFVLFEGMLQAFVFAMLALTYLSIAIVGDEPPTGDLP